MPLKIGEEVIYTAHASKQSKISMKIFEAHTSVLVPLLIIPVLPFMITIKISLFVVLVLVLLERRGWTLGIALSRLRSRMAGRYRSRNSKARFVRRMKDI